MVPKNKRFCTACGEHVAERLVKPVSPTPYSQAAPVIESTRASIKPAEARPTERAVKDKPVEIKKPPARRLLLRVVLPLIAVAVFAGGLLAIYTFLLRKPGHLDDKRLLEAYYGPPPFFTVILAKDERRAAPATMRREVWVYPERHVSFVFLGDEYQFSSDLKSVGKSAARAASRLRIEQITESLSVDDLSKLIGNKPVSQAGLPKEELADAIRYEYGNGIRAVFSQGRLLMIQVMPASKESE